MNSLFRFRRVLQAIPLLLLVPSGVAAQDLMARAFDLERRGSYEEAASVYRTLLTHQPGELGALLGLERALTPLNRVATMLPEVRAALAQPAVSAQGFSVSLRVYAAAGLSDSLPRLVDRWARTVPKDETPYREWAGVALQHRDLATARLAYRTGRERLGDPEALAAEIAQSAVLDENWPLAAREWAVATRRLPGYRASAITSLSQAPEPGRDAILQTLKDGGSPEARRIAAELMARWGDPVGAFALLLTALPAPAGPQIEQLQAFLEVVKVSDAPAYRRAQATTLEALAERWTVPAQRARLRLEAARAYAGAGDLGSSRRLLAQLAADSSDHGVTTAEANAALIELLAQEGNLEDASRQLLVAERSLAVDEFLRLRRAVALGWGQRGDSARAFAVLAPDSSVEASALRGWIALFRGNLRLAVAHWQEAGPFAGTRANATERASILALLQRVESDTLPALGTAYRLLSAGDSVAAAGAFVGAAALVSPSGGGAEMLERAGSLYRLAGRPEQAEQTLRAAISPAAPSASAAALLELGRLYLTLGRRDEAVQVLERLVLEFPVSALVPQARRLLDEARRAIPAT